MSWKVKYAPARAAVVLTVAGEIRNDDARAQTVEVLGLLDRHQTKDVLLDCSGALSEMTLPEIYWLADYAAELPVPSHIRVAVVAPRTRYRIESYQFFELVFRNAGYDVKLFDERKAAEAWLAATQLVRPQAPSCAHA